MAMTPANCKCLQQADMYTVFSHALVPFRHVQYVVLRAMQRHAQ